MSTFADFKDNLLEFGLEPIGRFYSDYRGIVVANNDPDFRGRLQVSVPQVYGKDIPDYWAPSKGMFTGSSTGFYALPKPGDSIWVSFEMGDPKYPIWTYGAFLPNTSPDTEKDYSYIFQTTAGQRLEFNDSGFLRLTGLGGTVFEINETGISLGAKTAGPHNGGFGDVIQQILTAYQSNINALLTAIDTFATAAGVAVPSLSAAGVALIASTAPIAAAIEELTATIEASTSKIVTLT